MAFSGSLLCAAPQGGQVRAGQAQITQQGKVTNINQSSQKAAINWQKFNIAADETVNFKQPNAHSITLNRVIGNEKSVINGAMNANGKVFLLNPHGTLIGKGAKINVGGLVASTANISDDDFMQGKYRFTGNGSGAVENYGEIVVPNGGVVALIAPIVKNNGNIKADSASVLLASAEHFSITLPENGDFSYTIDKGTLQGLVDNGGAVLADGGVVVLTAAGLDSVKKSVVRHTGIIQANTVANKNGKILLLGDLDNSRTEVSGVLSAEAPISGDGGFIETSANQVQIDDNAFVSTKAANGKTGEWLIDPADYTVAASGGDITGQAVSNALQNNNLTLKSTNGKADGKGDVVINDTINWDKNTLTLNAQNDIHINKTINGEGSAKLALQYGQASADGGESNYYLDKDVRVNLPAGQNLSTQKGKSGEVIEFEVIHKMPEIVKNSDGNYESQFTSENIAIGKDIDLSYTKNYQGFSGWEMPNQKKQNIVGLGHYLTSLKLYSNGDNVGLFTKLYNIDISYLYLKNIDVKSFNTTTMNENNTVVIENTVGGLVGKIESDQMRNNDRTEVVSVTDSVLDHVFVSGIVSGYNNVGGIVGGVFSDSVTYIDTWYNMQIHNTTFSGTVAGVSNVGGIVGQANDTLIENSNSTGNIQLSDVYQFHHPMDRSGFYGPLGGLVGSAEGSTIMNSHSSSNIQVNDTGVGVGGLIGSASYSNISGSYATGNISKSGNSGSLLGVGGLIGSAHTSNIIQSYATNTVTGDGEVGGLIGSVSGKSTITQSFSSGVVSGRGTTGGLVGEIDGEQAVIISQSYSSSNVSSESIVGGLVGYNSNGHLTIENSYATGILSQWDDYNDGVGYVGGLVGIIIPSSDNHKTTTIKNSYFSGEIHTGNANSKIGGIVASDFPYRVTIMPELISENVYYNKDKVATGGKINGQTVGTGLTTAQMQDKNSFKGFDFDNVWTIKDGETPTLLAFNGSGTPTGGDNMGGDNQQQGGDNQQQGGDNQQQGGDNQQQGGENQQQGGDTDNSLIEQIDNEKIVKLDEEPLKVENEREIIPFTTVENAIKWLKDPNGTGYMEINPENASFPDSAFYWIQETLNQEKRELEEKIRELELELSLNGLKEDRAILTPQVIEMALLSKSVYSDYGAPKGWKRTVTTDDVFGKKDFGLYGALFCKENTTECVLVFRGTEPSSLPDSNIWDMIVDMGADFAQLLLPTGSSQYDLAQLFVLILRQQGHNISHITGHSLGGGLAQYTAALTGIPATVFNAAGLGKKNKERVEKTVGCTATSGCTHINNVTFGDDIVSPAGTQLGVQNHISANSRPTNVSSPETPITDWVVENSQKPFWGDLYAVAGTIPALLELTYTGAASGAYEVFGDGFGSHSMNSLLDYIGRIQIKERLLNTYKNKLQSVQLAQKNLKERVIVKGFAEWEDSK